MVKGLVKSKYILSRIKHNYVWFNYSCKDLSLIQKWLRIIKDPVEHTRAVQIVKNYFYMIDPRVVYRL